MITVILISFHCRYLYWLNLEKSMSRVLRVFSRFFNREVIVSESASLFKCLFDDNNVEDPFFDAVLRHFIGFDQFHQGSNKITLEDIDYITQCTMADLTSKEHTDRSLQRINSYLYIYRRIEEYSQTFRKPYDILNQFRQQLFDLLTMIFVSTAGEKPNIHIQQEQHLLKMRIPDHLSSIIYIDDENTLLKFFVLCKLSMQSALIVHEYHDLVQWIPILSKVQTIKFAIEKFIESYLANVKAFEQFSINVEAFVYIIQRLHPAKITEESPFRTFIILSRELKLSTDQFLDQFQAIFANGVKKNNYQNKHIIDILLRLRKQDPTFYKYLFSYALNASQDDLWDIFLSLSEVVKFNENVKKSLISVLSQVIPLVSVSKFVRYAQSAAIRVTNISTESYPYFCEIFEKVFDTFLIPQMADPKYSYQFIRADYKNLLQVDLAIISGNRLERPACLLLVRKNICEIDNNIKLAVGKIRALFENLKALDQNLCTTYRAEDFISDDMLKFFIINNLEIWLKFNRESYEYLCNTHLNNPWTIYTWKRLVHLSLAKFSQDNVFKILPELDKWMDDVQHHIYHSTDILTIIFVTKLFELVISQYTRSILALPNTKTIMNYIVTIYQDQSPEIDITQLEAFVQAAREVLQEVLQLKSK